MEKKRGCGRIILRLALAAGISALGLAGCSNEELVRAAQEGNIARVQALIHAGADLRETDVEGRTALVCAARDGHTGIAEALIAAGADVNAAGHDGETALMAAAAGGHTALARALIAAGADVNKRSATGETALMLAALKGQESTAKALISAGADVGAERKDGWTALMDAAQGGYAGVVRALVAAGADVNATQKEGWTALMYARQAGYPDIVGTLVSAGAYGAAELHSPAELAPAPIEDAVLHSSVDLPNFRLPERPDDFAVVVGVEKYDLFQGRALYAERDAEAASRFFAALGVPSRHLALLLGPKATGNLLKSRVETWLKKNVDPDSRVYFYFSGHGAPDPIGKEAYLVPYDGDPSDLKDTGYAVERLYGNLAKLGARQVLVMLDACFSGAGGRSVLAQGARPLVTVTQAAPRGEVRVLAAAGKDQITSDMPGQGHGLFTYYLLKGLNGEGASSSGRVTVRSLYDYLRPRVADEAKLLFGDQVPQLLPAQWRGAWVLR